MTERLPAGQPPITAPLLSQRDITPRGKAEKVDREGIEHSPKTPGKTALSEKSGAESGALWDRTGLNTRSRAGIRRRLPQADPRCTYCGCSLPKLGKATLDHVIPPGRRGADATANLVLSCKLCNACKADLTPGELLPWAQRICEVAGGAGG